MGPEPEKEVYQPSPAALRFLVHSIQVCRMCPRSAVRVQIQCSSVRGGGGSALRDEARNFFSRCKERIDCCRLGSGWNSEICPSVASVCFVKSAIKVTLYRSAVTL
jgi:hypothetical protein